MSLTSISLLYRSDGQITAGQVFVLMVAITHPEEIAPLRPGDME